MVASIKILLLLKRHAHRTALLGADLRVGKFEFREDDGGLAIQKDENLTLFQSPTEFLL